MCMDRLKCCWNSCTTCLRDCSETQCCFWSMLLLGQLFVLIIFIISLVLCLLAGVNMFISSGCAAVYVLGDDDVCTETLLTLQNFITTFTLVPLNLTSRTFVAKSHSRLAKL